jgi:hypothetical protein
VYGGERNYIVHGCEPVYSCMAENQVKSVHVLYTGLQSGFQVTASQCGVECLVPALTVLMAGSWFTV